MLLVKLLAVSGDTGGGDTEGPGDDATAVAGNDGDDGGDH